MKIEIDADLLSTLTICTSAARREYEEKNMPNIAKSISKASVRATRILFETGAWSIDNEEQMEFAASVGAFGFSVHKG